MSEVKFDNYFWQNDKVKLRPWSEEDWEWIYNNGFDTSLGRLAGYKVDFPPTVAAAKEYSKNVADCVVKNDCIVFAVENLEGINMGRIILSMDDDRNGTFGIGIRLATEFHGNGYGTSAMKILLRYGFMERRFNKVCCTVLESNEASIKMHKKLGYEQEGLLKENIFMEGRYQNEVCLGITRSMYLKNIEGGK